MKKQLFFLYFLMFVIIATGVVACIILLQSDKNEATLPAEDFIYESLPDVMLTVPEPSENNSSDETKSEAVPQMVYDEEAMLKYEDFRGWLMIPDTLISYPVVQGTDNSFYLRHAYDGSYNYYGSLFLDTRSTEDARNRVIHGHNMGRNRTEMFSPLVSYQKQDYADNHNILYFSEPGKGSAEYRLFAVANFDTERIDEFDYRQGIFETDEEYMTFINRLISMSEYNADFVPTAESEILILSTCNRTYGESNRLLICLSEIE